MDYLLIFINTHYAFVCEKVLNKKKIYYNIMPSPPKIANSCGISISIKECDLKIINEMIEKKEISVKCIYDIKNDIII